MTSRFVLLAVVTLLATPGCRPKGESTQVSAAQGGADVIAPDRSGDAVRIADALRKATAALVGTKGQQVLSETFDELHARDYEPKPLIDQGHVKECNAGDYPVGLGFDAVSESQARCEKELRSRLYGAVHAGDMFVTGPHELQRALAAKVDAKSRNVGGDGVAYTVASGASADAAAIRVSELLDQALAESEAAKVYAIPTLHFSSNEANALPVCFSTTLRVVPLGSTENVRTTVTKVSLNGTAATVSEIYWRISSEAVPADLGKVLHFPFMAAAVESHSQAHTYIGLAPLFAGTPSPETLQGEEFAYRCAAGRSCAIMRGKNVADGERCPIYSVMN